MDEAKRKKAKDTLPKDEKELSDYLVKMSIALIVAAWALFSEYGKDIFLLLAIILSIVFDAMIAIKWGLRLAHYHKIIDATKKKPKAYDDFGLSNTWLGRTVDRIHYINFFVFGAAVILFIIGGIRVIYEFKAEALHTHGA